MTSTELKHQAYLQKWAAEVRDCRNSELSAVVQRTWDHAHYILSLGTRTAENFRGGIFLDRNSPHRICGVADTETSVSEQFGMLRNTSGWQWLH